MERQPKKQKTDNRSETLDNILLQIVNAHQQLKVIFGIGMGPSCTVLQNKSCTLRTSSAQFAHGWRRQKNSQIFCAEEKDAKKEHTVRFSEFLLPQQYAKTDNADNRDNRDIPLFDLEKNSKGPKFSLVTGHLSRKIFFEFFWGFCHPLYS
eukprot:Phypoly_transcript_19646.p1 GENE.Phypoly_transcript_19646~~Phypoly_transcript_19646.p1  ORF type:complete len:151 (+),score=16.96 Phypoly_transcript_19646:253-705(+)